MTDEIKRIMVKPATNPETGEPYYTWHPSAFKRAIPAEGALVPLDLYTQRYLRDGTWTKVDEATATTEPAPKNEPREDLPVPPRSFVR